jgi:choloylglycine hydrolase
MTLIIGTLRAVSFTVAIVGLAALVWALWRKHSDTRRDNAMVVFLGAEHATPEEPRLLGEEGLCASIQAAQRRILFGGGIVSRLVLFVLALAAGPVAMACTTVCLSEGGPPIVAKSYDWNHEDGHVVLNPAGRTKHALIVAPGQVPLSWTSKYASVSFNQYGAEMPNGGMNEAGLVVEIMWLNEAGWEPADGRPVINELQWVQRQLDLYASTQEVVSHVSEVRIAPIHGKVHYMVCDAGGACATVEFIGGKQSVNAGPDLRAPVLTNNTYARSIEALEDQRGEPALSDMSSLARFRRAAGAARSPASVEAAWGTLEGVRGPRTQWQIVYEPTRSRVQFRTRGTPQIRTLSLSELKPACQDGMRVLSMQAAGSGDVGAAMQAYEPAANQALVQAGLDALAADLPPALVPLVSSFHHGFGCAR